MIIVLAQICVCGMVDDLFILLARSFLLSTKLPWLIIVVISVVFKDFLKMLTTEFIFLK